jgi:hypothetical protein
MGPRFAALEQKLRNTLSTRTADIYNDNIARCNHSNPLDSGGDAAWIDSPAVACAATSELQHRDAHTASAFVIV